jgi:DNA-binding NarL/FixJ family response regulator
MIHALVVDDHPILRDGIQRVLQEIDGIASCDVADNGLLALEAMSVKQYSLVLMDIQMPVMDGYEATDIIMEKYPATKVLVISMMASRHSMLDMLGKGVQGYILKDSDDEDIAYAVKKIMDDDVYLCEEARKVWTEFLAGGKSVVQERVELTEREKEIIILICEQFTTEEIGDKLCIALGTVKNHRRHIMQKLNTENVVGIAMYAVRTGLYIP